MNLTQKNAPDTTESDQHSRDADQTRFLRMAFTLALTTILGLLGLEFFHPRQNEQTLFFTPEINHILVNGVLIGFFGLGAFIYGKNAGANEALAKMAQSDENNKGTIK